MAAPWERASESLAQRVVDAHLRVERSPGSSGARPELSIEVPARGLGLGLRLADLEFTDIDGHSIRISEFADARALVLLVRDSGCPVSRRYGPVLTRLEQRFADRDVSFLFLYQGEHESRDAARADMAAYECKGRAVYDEREVFMAELAIRTTTEAFVFDSRRTLVYRGAIDDQIGRGVVRDRADHEFLADAVEAVLAGGEVAVPATTAPGCLLAHDVVTPDETPPVTYHDTISRIVQRDCLTCHRPGGAAPFSLETLQDVRGRRAMIRFVVENRIMPPWFASEGSGPWRNDPSLPERDWEHMLSWIDAGCPEGDPADAPLPRAFPGPGEWIIGEPDEVLQIPAPITVPAEGRFEYQRVVLPPRKEGRWIKKIQIQPTAPEVVHHVTTHYRTLQNKDHAFEAYVPGKPPTEFPAGEALYLPAGARLEFSIHYTPIGVEVVDQLRMALVYAERPPESEVVRLALSERRFKIPAGHPSYPVESEVTLDQPILLRSLTPHMHLRGKSFLVEAFLPAGERRELLQLPQWDFAWQFAYEFVEPIALPVGSRLKFTGTFDNSSANPANPDPTRIVGYGRWSDREMMMLAFEFLLQ